MAQTGGAIRAVALQPSDAETQPSLPRAGDRYLGGHQLLSENTHRGGDSETLPAAWLERPVTFGVDVHYALSRQAAEP